MSLPQTTSELIQGYYNQLSTETQQLLDLAMDRLVKHKKNGGKVMVITGSGPNLHEGVTTLIAELMKQGIVDGVSTSSAVIAHELAGTLDQVKRVDGTKLGLSPKMLPKGNVFEFNVMSEELLNRIRQEITLDDELLAMGSNIEGSIIAKAHGLPFETVAGWGADPHTMIGVGARLGLPVLVSVPQLIGGGGVGLAIGDSISISERCMRMAQMIDNSSVLIESAIALTQEIHDGPFETYTGHGIWANWDGYPTTRLEDKTLIRIDLDSNLKRAWDMQRSDSTVQTAIDKGLPKTKLTGIPFRMEMSGFARLEGSLPLVGDIGVIWPIFAWKVSQSLGIELEFISHPQQTPEGQSMREWIVSSIQPFNRTEMIEHSRSYRRNQ
jgi:hypothetical protein